MREQVCKLAVANGLAFLPFYAWVGLWSALYLALLSLFSFSNVVETFTRFTDEVFSGLVSMIYIVDALKDLAKPPGLP